MRRYKIVRDAAVYLLPLIIYGCMATNTSSTGFNIVPLSQEIEIGKQLSQQIDKKFPIYSDREVRLYVSYLGNRLVKAYGGHTLFDYHFRVLDDEEINAFNIPGGYIYLHRGMIARVDNEAELAAVLSHEIGHALARHSTQLMSTQLGLSFVLSMILGPETSQWEKMAADLFAGVGILAYTRSMEREADRLAILIMHQAGYDPRAALTLMDKMLALKKREPHALEKLFSSHPTTSERIKNARDDISRLTLRRGLFLNTSRFDQIKKIVETDPYPKNKNSFKR